MSPIIGILTDPGPVCPGDTVTVTCNITRGLQQLWTYNGVMVGDPITPISIMVPVLVQGVDFRLSLLSTQQAPYLATQIAFTASEMMDGRTLLCKTIVGGSQNLMIAEMRNLQVGSSSELNKWSIAMVITRTPPSNA